MELQPVLNNVKNLRIYQKKNQPPIVEWQYFHVKKQGFWESFLKHPELENPVQCSFIMKEDNRFFHTDDKNRQYQEIFWKIFLKDIFLKFKTGSLKRNKIYYTYNI